MNTLTIGNRTWNRDKFFATIFLAKPEEMVIAGAMKKMGYTALDREAYARRLIVSFSEQVLADGMIGEPLDRIKAELDRLEHSSVALDEAASRLPLPKTKVPK